MATAPQRVRIYATPNGRTPFTEWLEGIRDQHGRTLLKSRLDRVALGNFGDCKSIGDGVSELRVDFGPGYRIYFGKEVNDVILLWGGKKHRQAQDITRAKIYWADYTKRSRA